MVSSEANLWIVSTGTESHGCGILISIVFYFQGALFQSPHIDENDVQTISHKCEMLSYTEYKKTQRPDSHVTRETDVYYLAGTYEPTIGLLKFEKDVMWFTYCVYKKKCSCVYIAENVVETL